MPRRRGTNPAARGAFERATAKKRRAKLRQLAERDKWICHICEQPVDPELFGVPNHPMAPSGDHKVRRADGGRSAPENLALAHRKCNSEKEENSLPGGRDLAEEERRLVHAIERTGSRLRKANTYGDRERYVRNLEKSMTRYEHRLIHVRKLIAQL